MKSLKDGTGSHTGSDPDPTGNGSGKDAKSVIVDMIASVNFSSKRQLDSLNLHEASNRRTEFLQETFLYTEYMIGLVAEGISPLQIRRITQSIEYWISTSEFSDGVRQTR